MLHRDSLPGFFALAYGFAWVAWGAALLLQDAGIGQATMALVGFDSFGPTLAALAVTARAGGLPGVRALLGRALIWRVGLRWYLAVLLGPALVSCVAAAIVALRGGHAFSAGGALPAGYPPYLAPLAVVAIALVSLVFGGPLGEELGWRGFALPRLQAARDSRVASLMLGALWAFWHLPLFWIEGTSQAAMPPIPFLCWVVALAVIFTAVYRGTGGSLLIALLLHTSVNVTAGLFAVLPDATAGRRDGFVIYVALVGLIAFAVVAAEVAHPRVSRRTRHSRCMAIAGQRFTNHSPGTTRQETMWWHGDRGGTREHSAHAAERRAP